MRLNKPAWNWKYCILSGWSFQVGEPHLVTHSFKRMPHLRKRHGNSRTFVHGEFTLHVFYAKWAFHKNGKTLVSSRCSLPKIEMHFARLDGTDLRTIQFHKEGWVQKATFSNSIVLTISPYVGADNESIANWLENSI